MKYKCTDCGQEYDVKPEFCDCGNNLFEEIQDVIAKDEQKIVKSGVASATKIQKSSPSNRIDMPSLLIFILCIILSILSLIFIGRDTTQTLENTVSEQIQANAKEIPSIDKLWKEKIPSTATVTPQPVIEPELIKVVEKKSENKTIKKTETSKKAVASTSKPTQQVVSKPQQAAQQKPQQTTQPKSQPTSTMTEQEKQAIIERLTTKKTQTQQSQQPKVETPKTETNQVAVQPKQEPVKTEVKPEVQAPNPQQLKKELESYKIALRNKLGKSINFAAVIGDGNCAVTFKLDQTGNLINRKFSVQSKNNSLNDAVYSAMMQNATFKEPPAGYSGETLTLTVKMYGGNFEVTLK